MRIDPPACRRKGASPLPAVRTARADDGTVTVPFRPCQALSGSTGSGNDSKQSTKVKYSDT